ncbi:O-antigen ligase [Providencia alcalifaciens]|nr:O-antigen ligase [Providencia alcalifaciens]
MTSLTASIVPIKKVLYVRLQYLVHYKLLILGWLLFMAGIAIAGIMNHGIGLYTLIKYSLFIVVFSSLIIISVSPIILEKALAITLMVSLLPLLFLALLRETDALVVFADGRMGWVASWPGIIWKIGAFIWPLAVWHLLNQPNKMNILFAFSSVLVMSLDGSRTSIVWMVLVTISLVGIATFIHKRLHSLRTYLYLILVAVLPFFVIQPTLLGWVSGYYDQHITQSINNHIDNSLSITSDITLEKSHNGSNESVAYRLVEGDNSVRLHMLKAGWKTTLEKFPWGNGFGSTRVDDFGANSVIHMTYLQLLADEGIVSLIGYLLFLITPLYYGVKFITQKRELFAERFEFMLCPLSIITLYLFIGIFHPLSNELTEWAIVLTAIASVVTHVPHRH